MALWPNRNSLGAYPMPELIAAIDVGTTGARTIIFNINGNIRANAYQEYPILTPKPGWVEQDANRWWQAVVTTTKKALKSKGVNAKDIAVITVTNQRETVVPVDKTGKALHNAIVWQDRRTKSQCQRISDSIGSKKIYRTTGLTIDPYFSASKIMWLKEHKPKIFKRTYKFLLVHDYILHKLTGKFVTDYSNASRTMLFDIQKFQWSNDICGVLGIPIDTLPSSKKCGTSIGEITSEAARSTGFKIGTPITTGGGDQQCAALGLGVIREGQMKATTGTGTFAIAPLNKPKLDPKMRVLCSVSVIPNQWILEASIFTTGAVYRWYRDNFAQMESERAKKLGVDVYELLNQEVARAEPGAHGLFIVPHFAGAGAPYWDPDAKGILYGLTLGHTKQDILRAIIEGVCFEVKGSLKVFSDLGVDISELRIAGGATRSPVWNQLQADIYGISVAKTMYEETTALGAAILGGLGVKLFKSPQDAVKNMVELKTKYKPRPKLKTFYEEKYYRYKKLYETLAGKDFS